MPITDYRAIHKTEALRFVGSREGDLWWPPIGSRVRYLSSRGGMLIGKVVSDYRATSRRVAIWRDGENTRSVVFRNRDAVELVVDELAQRSGDPVEKYL